MSFLQLRTPSFRSRLRLFFVVIVILPMITMALVLYLLIVEAERSQTDARLSQAQTVAQQVLREEQAAAGKVAQRIGGDQEIANARMQRDEAAIQDRLDTLTRRHLRETFRTIGLLQARVDLDWMARAERMVPAP